MFPEPHLENLYQSFMSENVDNGAALASAFSAWLVELGGSQALMEALDDCPSSLEKDVRISFSLAMGLLSTTERTPIIFDLYENLLSARKYQGHVTVMLSNAGSKGVITDVVCAFSLFKDIEHEDLAVSIYDTDILEVRKHAFAQDNLEVFLKTTDDNAEFHSAFESYFIIASFPLRPDSLIYKHFVTNDNQRSKLLAARLRRHWIETFQDKQLKIHDFYEYPDPSTPSLIPGNKNRLKVGDFREEASPLDDPYLIELLAKDPQLAISSTLPNDRVEKNQARVFQSFLAKLLSLGFSAQQMITYGPAMVSRGGVLVDLDDSVRTFASLSQVKRSLYEPIFKQHLSEFEPQEIALACKSDDEIIAMYDLLRDNAFLKAASPRLRERMLNSDLGL